MGVTIPSYHLKSEHDMPETRKRLKGFARKREINRDITLTSLIDVFSVVIIFLIQSFSASGEILVINQGINLPQAYYGAPLSRAPIVTILPDKVTVEGLQVGDNQQIEDRVEESDWDLPLLRAKLEEYRNFVQSIYPGAPFAGEVIIQADSDLDFLYLKRVLYALTKIGFSNINLAVRGEVAEPIAESLGSPNDLLSAPQEILEEFGTEVLDFVED